MSKQDVLVRKSTHNDKRYNKRYNKNKDYHHRHRKSKKKRVILICVLCIAGILLALLGYAASILLNSDKYDPRTMFRPKETDAAASTPPDAADANEGGPDAAVHAALFPMRFIYDCFSIPPACQTESRLILYLKPHKRYHPTGAGIGCIFLRSVLWMAKIETFVTIL